MNYLLAQHRKPAVPKELRTIYFLSGRMELTPSMNKKFYRLQRGYLGELNFYNFIRNANLNKLTSEKIVELYLC